jgi:hypothetical protein
MRNYLAEIILIKINIQKGHSNHLIDKIFFRKLFKNKINKK